ncbi:hypothetical protein HDV00_001660 [Rhizophlyctis rosea]|nr:hypothetical protein HDV00_001660 [Rhizophlyctis rosea]
MRDGFVRRVGGGIAADANAVSGVNLGSSGHANANAGLGTAGVAGLVRKLDFGFRPYDLDYIRPPHTPAPTPATSANVTPASSTQGSPTFGPVSPPMTPPSFTLHTSHMSTPLPSFKFLSHRLETLSHATLSSTSPPSTPEPIVHFSPKPKERYGASWTHRFIGPALTTLSLTLPNITHLVLSGAQFHEEVLVDALKQFGKTLEHLDLSHSNIRKGGIEAIPLHCGKLKSLDLSGIFRFRRIPTRVLVDVVNGCALLEKLVLLGCNDVGEESVRGCKGVREGLDIVVERGELTVVREGSEEVDLEGEVQVEA